MAEPEARDFASLRLGEPVVGVLTVEQLMGSGSPGVAVSVQAELEIAETPAGSGFMTRTAKVRDAEPPP